MIPTPIRQVLLTFQKHGVRSLLMAGQACVFYGAAQVSKDIDFTMVADGENFARLHAALAELAAERIAVPRFDPAVLARGHAVHYRCRAMGVDLIFLFKIFLSELPLHAQTPTIAYELPRAGNVSLAVYNMQGRQVRTLLTGESQTAGKHSAGWDGLDRLGHAMAVGTYEWRLLLNFTVSFWLRTKQPTQPMMQGSFELWLADGQPHLNFGGWGTSASTGPRLDDGQWHHLAFVWDESGGKRAMSLYQDGLPAATGTGPAASGTDKFSLGVSNQLTNKNFIGSFDEIRVYQRTLTALLLSVAFHFPLQV